MCAGLGLPMRIVIFVEISLSKANMKLWKKLDVCYQGSLTQCPVNVKQLTIRYVIFDLSRIVQFIVHIYKN